MNVSSSELRARARLKLKNNYWNALLAVVVQGVLFSVGSPLALILAGALTIGLSTYFLHLADRQDSDITDIFTPFKQQFGNSIIFCILQWIYVFLWSLVFVIPGIIASFSYVMAPYILAEHPEMSASDALKLSKDMMRGNKGKFFCLQFSFIGWILLSVFTFGIGILFLIPYINAANAEFFNEVSGKNAQRGTFDPAPSFTPPYGAPQGGFDNGFGSNN